MRLAFIGGGVMGEAMVKALLARKVASPSDLAVSDVVPARREYLVRTYGVLATADNAEAARGRELVVLAVKPQDLARAVASLKGRLGPEPGVLSIVAGATLATLTQGLETRAVIRAMPNMPAQVGEGMTVWTATPEVSEGQKALARALLGALGRERYVAEEKYLDMATAVSGSGPAYVFLVMEALMDGAVHVGLPRELAREMVVQTVLGSARALQEMGGHPAELRNLVSSPGGTTVEGLLALEEGAIRALFTRAIIAACEKAQELGGKG